jgi:NTE family protein
VIIEQYNSPPSAPPKIALVLSSGGLNALAALPLLQFLETHKIKPDLLVGCSGGSLTLARWALGHSPQDAEAFLNSSIKPSLFVKDWRSIATMLGVYTKGFNLTRSVFKSEPILKTFRGLYGDGNIEDLKVPLILQATDFQTGEGVELESGNLVESIYASCSAYPFFHPVRIKGRSLIDGAYSAPLPILPAVRRGMDVIIAMDFSDKLDPNPKSFFEAMMHLNCVLGRAVSQMLASIDLHNHEILLIKVRFPGVINIWQTEAYSKIMAAGRAAVEEYGPEILALCKTPHAAAHPSQGG